jgi:hypothetical protein
MSYPLCEDGDVKGNIRHTIYETKAVRGGQNGRMPGDRSGQKKPSTAVALKPWRSRGNFHSEEKALSRRHLPTHSTACGAGGGSTHFGSGASISQNRLLKSFLIMKCHALLKDVAARMMAGVGTEPSEVEAVNGNNSHKSALERIRPHHFVGA